MRSTVSMKEFQSHRFSVAMELSATGGRLRQPMKALSEFMPHSVPFTTDRRGRRQYEIDAIPDSAQQELRVLDAQHAGMRGYLAAVAARRLILDASLHPAGFLLRDRGELRAEWNPQGRRFTNYTPGFQLGDRVGSTMTSLLHGALREGRNGPFGREALEWFHYTGGLRTRRDIFTEHHTLDDVRAMPDDELIQAVIFQDVEELGRGGSQFMGRITDVVVALTPDSSPSERASILLKSGNVLRVLADLAGRSAEYVRDRQLEIDPDDPDPPQMPSSKYWPWLPVHFELRDGALDFSAAYKQELARHYANRRELTARSTIDFVKNCPAPLIIAVPGTSLYVPGLPRTSSFNWLLAHTARAAEVTVLDPDALQPEQLTSDVPDLLVLGEAALPDLSKKLSLIPPYGRDDFEALGCAV